MRSVYPCTRLPKVASGGVGWGWNKPAYVGLKYTRLMSGCVIVQELCKSLGGRHGPSVLTSLLVSVKQY